MASSNNDNSAPPIWLQRLERRLQDRMNREQDPFKTNSLMNKLMYSMMLLLSLTAMVLIPIHAFLSHSIYLIVFLIFGLTIWGTLSHRQHKRGRTIWHGFPTSFREYVLKRNALFRASWHLIFITLITGFFIMASRYLGLEDVFVPHKPGNIATIPRTPEQQATLDAIARIAGQPPAATAPKKEPASH